MAYIMIIVAGLGNPERRYNATRHNVGFAVADELADRYGLSFRECGMNGLCAETYIGWQKVMILKPLTYMNLSGECISKYMNYFKLEPENLIVAYDDISLDVGTVRIRKKGSAGGHNGMKNIISMIGTQQFPRVRLGIGQCPPYMDLVDYVLGRFPSDELATVRESIGTAADAIELMIESGIDDAMNRFNKRHGEKTAHDMEGQVE